MGVGLHRPVAGEVLAHRAHARLAEAGDEGAGQLGGHLRIAVEGAVADHRTHTVIEVEHRRVAEVDAMGAQLGGQHEAGAAGRLPSRRRIGAPGLAEAAHRRQPGKAVTEALHAAAFMVHRDHQARAHRPDRRRQRPQLARLGVVAGKQDHAADQRVLQDLALLGADFVADHVEHDGTGGAMGWLHGFSMTAKATT